MLYLTFEDGYLIFTSDDSDNQYVRRVEISKLSEFELLLIRYISELDDRIDTISLEIPDISGLDLSNYVQYTNKEDGTRSIVLQEDEELEGEYGSLICETDGYRVDVGNVMLPLNLNTEERVTINGEAIVATLDDIPDSPDLTYLEDDILEHEADTNIHVTAEWKSNVVQVLGNLMAKIESLEAEIAKLKESTASSIEEVKDSLNDYVLTSTYEPTEELINAHVENYSIHTTQEEKNRWELKADSETLEEHMTDAGVHATTDKQILWFNKMDRNDVIDLIEQYHKNEMGGSE